MFDLDGTLLDSMDEKAESFALATLRVYPKASPYKNRIKEIYVETKGTPRAIQLSLVLHELGYAPLSEKESDIWSEYFSQYYLPTKPDLFTGAKDLLEKLKQQGKKIIISTGAPQEELEQVLSSNNLNTIVDLALGHKDSAFSKGQAHFQRVIREFNIEKEDIVFVGDGAKDVQICISSGVDCIGVFNTENLDSREGLKRASPKMLIETIGELKNLL